MTNLYVFRDGEEVGTIHGMDSTDCAVMAQSQNLTPEFGYEWRWESMDLEKLSFSQLISRNPTPMQLIEWNFIQVKKCVARGDSENARVFAIEAAHWALFYGKA